MSVQSASIYTDLQGVAKLKAQAKDDAGGALDAVARQFESLMLSQMLKTMRQANLGEGLMDSDQTLFYRDMYDQQLAIHLSENGGIGLADVIKRQLGGVQPKESAPDANTELRKIDAAATTAPTRPQNVKAAEFESADDFVESLLPLAKEAAAKVGLSPVALLSQAALESGWGQRVMKTPDGNSSHNLFGIKADARWDGDKVNHLTLEFEEGVAVRKKEAFRAYDSFRESFMDYVEFLKSNPRYRETLEAANDPAAYFKSLQQAGYATDPAYAEKVLGVVDGKEMNSALSRIKNS